MALQKNTSQDHRKQPHNIEALKSLSIPLKTKLKLY